MKHLLIGREYPPAQGGGIGTYMQLIAALLAGAGETVHAVALASAGAPAREASFDGRLTVHRVEVAPQDAAERALCDAYHPWLFAKRAAAVAERLIVEHDIDIVEGCEFEAPLYVLQHRRSLGRGPARKPPVLVHMHGATDVAFCHGVYDPGMRYNRLASRLERFSIARADQLLFPSRHYAASSQAQFAIAPGRSAVIPYPIELGAAPARPEEVWRSGSLLFVGRLDYRKGVCEWLDAASRLARRHAGLRFEFAGANRLADDWRSGEAVLRSLLPADLAQRFVFHGPCDAARLHALRQAARIAVVPSRWDNLPYTALEAMAAGLPVLATAASGVAEVMRDGQEGWIAPECAALDLMDAAERALALPPAALARAGEAARARVAETCCNRRTLADHLALRDAMLRRAAAAEAADRARGAAPVIAAVALPDWADRVANPIAAARRLSRAQPADGYLVEDPGVVADAGFLPAATALLRSQPDIGIVAAWVRGADGVVVSPDADTACQLLENGMDGPLLVRASALPPCGAVKDADGPELARWAAVLQAMQSGWRCVVLPEALGERRRPAPPPAYTQMAAWRRELHRRFPDAVAAHATQLIALAASPMTVLAGPRQFPLPVQFRMARRLYEAGPPFLRVLLARAFADGFRRAGMPWATRL
jgi:glycosyltransferase involved in cell wall biosynthesis